jgi:hypothetical protein
MSDEKTLSIKDLQALRERIWAERDFNSQTRIELIDEMIEMLKPKPRAESYYVLYAVRWQPRFEGDDPPLDVVHTLQTADERVTFSELLAIGNEVEINEQFDVHPFQDVVQ